MTAVRDHAPGGPLLHLLRPFTGWPTGNSPAAAERWIETMPEDDEFATWTARCPARAADLAGGSVYFVRARHTVFRMPFLRIEAIGRRFAILMTPRLIRVERKRVGFLRGWRYMAEADAPADAVPRKNGETGPMPAGLYHDLRELGLV